MTAVTDKTEMKVIIKEAIIEVLTENKEQFQSLIMDSLEETALSAAIKEGESSETVAGEEFDAWLDKRL